MSATTQSVINHHLKALAENDLSELIKDYNDDSELWIQQGRLVGRAAIEGFFAEAFKLFPTNQTSFNVTQLILTEDTAFIVWNSDSPAAGIPLGTDTFVFKEGKIVLQTVAAVINLKQQA